MIPRAPIVERRARVRAEGIVQRLSVALLVLMLVGVGCSPPASPNRSSSAGSTPAVTQPVSPPRIERVIAAVRADLPTVSMTLNAIIPRATALDVTIVERKFSRDEVSHVAWADGKPVPGDRIPIVDFSQLLTPIPPVTGNAQFRRALKHAVDRQEYPTRSSMTSRSSPRA